MSQIAAPWQATYRAGRWIVLATPACLVVTEPVNPDSELVPLWEDLCQTSSMAEVCELLAEWGLDTLHGLGVVVVEGARLRVRLKGGLRITDIDGVELAGGRGPMAWQVQQLDTPAFTIRCDCDPVDSPEMPLALGAGMVSLVRVRVIVGLEDEAVGPPSIRRPQGDQQVSRDDPADTLIREDEPEGAVVVSLAALPSFLPAEAASTDEDLPTAEDVEQEGDLDESGARDEGPGLDRQRVEDEIFDLAQAAEEDIFAPVLDAGADQMHTVTIRRDWRTASVVVRTDEDVAADEEWDEEEQLGARERLERAIALARIGSRKLSELTGLRQPDYGDEYTDAVDLDEAPGREDRRPEARPRPGPADEVFDIEAEGSQRGGRSARPTPAAEAEESLVFDFASMVEEDIRAPRPGGQPRVATCPPSPAHLGDEESINIDLDLDVSEPVDHPRSAPPREWVLAALCPARHINTPGTTSCATCGQAIDPRNTKLVRRPRHLSLVAPGGAVWPLRGPVIVGRAPQASRSPGATLVRVASPNHDISRSHLLVEARERDVRLEDLDSTNGSIVTMPGCQPVALDQGASMVVPPGTRIDLGDGQVLSVDEE